MANADGTTTLEGIFDTISLSKLPDRLECMAYCKVEAHAGEIGSTRLVRFELASANSVFGAPQAPALSWYEKEATVRGAAYGATPTLEILLNINAVIVEPGNYLISVSIQGDLAASAPILVLT